MQSICLLAHTRRARAFVSLCLHAGAHVCLIVKTNKQKSFFGICVGICGRAYQLQTGRKGWSFY